MTESPAVTRDTAVPFLPARPVRPMRCVYGSICARGGVSRGAWGAWSWQRGVGCLGLAEGRGVVGVGRGGEQRGVGCLTAAGSQEYAGWGRGMGGQRGVGCMVTAARNHLMHGRALGKSRQGAGNGTTGRVYDCRHTANFCGFSYSIASPSPASHPPSPSAASSIIIR